MAKTRRLGCGMAAMFVLFSTFAAFSRQPQLGSEKHYRDALRSQRERPIALNDHSQQVEQAYVTLIASPEYDIGAQILVCRLRHFSPDIPIYVLVVDSVKLQSNSFYKNMRAELIPVVNPTLLDSSLDKEVRSGTYSKLNVWQLDFIEKAVYLDADTLPVKNPQVLFSLLPDNKDYAVVGKPGYFNSGVFVYRPSNATYHHLLERLQKQDYVKQADPTEQDLLISHFGKSRDTVYIDEHFNYRPLHHHDGLDAKAVIVHYIGNPKPWTFMLGHLSSIEGQAVYSVPGKEGSHLPQWSIQLYMNEVERFFSYCHDPEP